MAPVVGDEEAGRHGRRIDLWKGRPGGGAEQRQPDNGDND
jgi:hypothetical protein